MLRRIARRIKKEAKLLRYRGRNYVCPFCNYRAKDLAPIGYDFPVLHEKKVVGGRLRKAACYKCGSTDRERLILAYLSDHLNVFKDATALRVLHIAPEPNLSALMLKAGFREYVCGDLFAEGYRYPSYVRNMSVLDLPFPDSYFNMVICNHVLEHIPDDHAAMRSIHRVLVPGGKAILQVPISLNSTETLEDSSIADPRQREAVFGQFDHVRLYGQDYGSRLASCSFTVSVVNISNTHPTWGLNPREDVFVGGKRIGTVQCHRSYS